MTWGGRPQRPGPPLTSTSPHHEAQSAAQGNRRQQKTEDDTDTLSTLRSYCVYPGSGRMDYTTELSEKLLDNVGAAVGGVEATLSYYLPVLPEMREKLDYIGDQLAEMADAQSRIADALERLAPPEQERRLAS